MSIPIYPPSMDTDDKNQGAWLEIYADDLNSLNDAYIIDRPGRYRLIGSIINPLIDYPLFVIENVSNVRLDINNSEILISPSSRKIIPSLLITAINCQEIVIENAILKGYQLPMICLTNIHNSTIQNIIFSEI